MTPNQNQDQKKKTILQAIKEFFEQLGVQARARARVNDEFDLLPMEDIVHEDRPINSKGYRIPPSLGGHN